MWPGFGENSRVLKWIFERSTDETDAVETAIGNLPAIDTVDFSGLDLSEDQIAELLRVEIDGWLSEIPLIEAYYDQFGDHVPLELREELRNLKQRLQNAKQAAA
jgi:phosphoenolpyruvate carboxykinase (GTP)